MMQDVGGALSPSQPIPARTRTPKIDPAIVSIISTIKNLDPNALTPRDALAALFELSEIAQKVSAKDLSTKDGA
jgi:hypothetical protein